MAEAWNVRKSPVNVLSVSFALSGDQVGREFTIVVLCLDTISDDII